MSVRPIIFSAPMVRALLAGRKTQTRRVLKLVPPADADQVHTWFAPPHVPTKGIANQWAESGLWAKKAGRAGYNRYVGALPYRPGDRLWVRETVRAEELKDGRDGVRYLADDAWLPIENTREAGNQWGELAAYGGKYRQSPKVPAIHMPRWASRLTLLVTDVRVERLQDIKGPDTIAEGVECTTCAAMHKSACGRLGCFASRLIFSELWNSINGAGAWRANPWVVAVTFNIEGAT